MKIYMPIDNMMLATSSVRDMELSAVFSLFMTTRLNLTLHVLGVTSTFRNSEYESWVLPSFSPFSFVFHRIPMFSVDSGTSRDTKSSGPYARCLFGGEGGPKIMPSVLMILMSLGGVILFERRTVSSAVFSFLKKTSASMDLSSMREAYVRSILTSSDDALFSSTTAVFFIVTERDAEVKTPEAFVSLLFAVVFTIVCCVWFWFWFFGFPTVVFFGFPHSHFVFGLHSVVSF